MCHFPFSDHEGIWSIKNKYYSCDVNLLIHQSNASNNDKLKIGASIWYVDCLTSENITERLKQWQNELKSYLNTTESGSEEDQENVEVQLIVAEKFDSEETKSTVTEWSIDHGVEIIDLSEDDEDSAAEEVTVFASNGRKRILEALQTVMWPEMCDTKTDDNNEVTEKDVESFESLFAKLVNFKETAAGLPDEERKKFAEKVALSFYSAIGDQSDDDDI